jgi:hypothetical protein
MHPVTRDAISRVNEQEKKEQEHRNSFLPIAPIARTICVLLNKLPNHQAWCRRLRGALELNLQFDEDGNARIIGKICTYQEKSQWMEFSECLWSLLDPYWVNASKVVDAIECGQLFMKQYPNPDDLQTLCQLASELLKFIAYYCARQNVELRETKVELDKTKLDSEEIKHKLERANNDIKKLEVELGAAQRELWEANTNASLDHVESPRCVLQSMLLQLQNVNA